MRNPEDVATFGSLLLQHYRHKLDQDECESLLWCAGGKGLLLLPCGAHISRR